MPLDDLASLFDPDLLLPVGGKTYRVRPPSAAVGLRMQGLQALAVKRAAGVQLSAMDEARLRLGDDEEVDLLRDALGAVYDQMITDDVPFPYLQHAGMTAFFHWAVGPKRAEEYWRSREGEARRPLSAAADAKASTSTAAVSTTKPARRGSGTTSHPKSSAGTKARKGRAGLKSSNTGD